ncbi:MAG: sortase [Herbinix sp.]|nr:sortase [Herbinix sp.]
MKPTKMKYINGKIRLFGLLAFGMIFVGILICSINLFKFSKSLFSVRSNVSSIQTNHKEILQENENAELTNINITSNESMEEQSIYPERPEAGDEIGELYIPKLEITLPIFEGTDEEELDLGIGHYSESVLPGENDNSVLSGHRDTVFRKLDKIGEGDLLIVRTLAGEFEYKVHKVRIVDKEDRTVIVPKPRATLTVSTCYPFTYVGPAPQRYILVAYLANETLY